MELKDKLNKIGIRTSKILLPKDTVDLNKWAVVACDQFTSEPEYWRGVEEYVGEAPSTLKITLPEVYLESENKSERVEKTIVEMKKYLSEGILEEKFEGMVLVEREIKNEKLETRKGLVVALDLEKYDYTKGSKTLIRATEGTVESRIPPRLEIRKNALVELPHIMVLIDDPNKTVIEPLFQKNLQKIYDLELMMDGGHIKGWQISDERIIENIADSLEKLISVDGFLFAMGDGNHSLATAKTHWNNIKIDLNDFEKENHPARFALVELVNIHDDGLEFEPIHRVVFNVDAEDLRKFLVGDSYLVDMVVSDKESWGLGIKDYGSNLPVGNLQMGLDEYLINHPEAKIDYVHGEDSVMKIVAGNSKTVGFLLKGMKKEELFPTVEKDGALPRKTFSMGEATEKRYYLEARKIVR
ncbi:MAG: DUF1015 domain-containing protein [Candidatus Shapirobacteria bacterium]